MEKIKEFFHVGGKDKKDEKESHKSDLQHKEKPDTTEISNITENPREIEQPAKQMIDNYKDEHPNKKINMTTTSTTTRSPGKDVTSTATINPFTETYTTTVTIDKHEDQQTGENVGSSEK